MCMVTIHNRASNRFAGRAPVTMSCRRVGQDSIIGANDQKPLAQMIKNAARDLPAAEMFRGLNLTFPRRNGNANALCVGRAVSSGSWLCKNPATRKPSTSGFHLTPDVPLHRSEQTFRADAEKGFSVPERRRIFHERLPVENIDSGILHFGFYYCQLWMVQRSLIDFFNSIGQTRTFREFQFSPDFQKLLPDHLAISLMGAAFIPALICSHPAWRR